MRNYQNEFNEMKNDYCFPKYTNEEIKEAFDIFDINKNEYIGVEELREIFSILGENVSDEELDEMISLADKEGDGQVNWFNFYEFITGNFAIDNEIKYMKRIEQEKNEEKSMIKNNKKKYKFLGEGEIDMITDINFSKNVTSKLGTTNLIKINKDENENKEYKKKTYKNEDDDEDFFSSEEDDEKKYGVNYENFIKNMLEKNNKNSNKIVIEDIDDDEKNKPKKIVLENVQKKYSMHTNSKGSDSLIMINNEEDETKEKKKTKKKMKDKNKIPLNKKDFSRQESNFIQNKNNQLINLNNINIKNNKNFDEKNKFKNLNDSSNLNLILDSEKNNNDLFKNYNEKNSSNDNNLILNSKNSSINKKNSKSNSLINSNSNDSNLKDIKNNSNEKSSNEKSTPKLISYENNNSLNNNIINTDENLILNINDKKNKMNLIDDEIDNNSENKSIFKKKEQNILINEENNNKNINSILINISKPENKDLIENKNINSDEIDKNKETINKNEKEKKSNKNNSKEKYLENNNSLISDEKNSEFKNDNFNSNIFEKKNKSIIYNKKNLPSINVEKKDIKSTLHKKINLNFFSNDNKNNNNNIKSNDLEKINSLKENSNEENEEDEIEFKKSGIIKHSKAMKPTKNFLQKITKLESEDLTNLDYKKIEEENNIKQQQYKNKIQPFDKINVKNEFIKVDLIKNISKKQSIKNLIKRENIKIKDILNLNNRFENNLNEELTYNKFIEKFRFQDNSDSNIFFENFKKTSKKNDDEIITIENVLILLYNNVDNNLLNKDKFNFEFKILDKNKSKYITKLDLINLIELNFLTSNTKEIYKKFNLVLNELKNMGYVDEEVFDYDILFELFNNKPNLFFPSK